MRLYFLLVRIAALFGHRKARLLIQGQRDVRAFLKSAPEQEPAIWIHAASVGEFEQARPLIERLTTNDKRQTTKIVVTFFSPSGYTLRKDYPLADQVLYLPFATRRNAKLFLNVIRPTKAIFVKYKMILFPRGTYLAFIGIVNYLSAFLIQFFFFFCHFLLTPFFQKGNFYANNHPTRYIKAHAPLPLLT